VKTCGSEPPAPRAPEFPTTLGTGRFCRENAAPAAFTIHRDKVHFSRTPEMVSRTHRVPKNLATRSLCLLNGRPKEKREGAHSSQNLAARGASIQADGQQTQADTQTHRPEDAVCSHPTRAPDQQFSSTSLAALACLPTGRQPQKRGCSHSNCAMVCTPNQVVKMR